MKLHLKRLASYAVVLGVVVMIFGVTLNKAGATDEKYFVLKGLDVAGKPVPNVVCVAKQTGVVYFKDGTQNVKQSSFLVANPTFSFIDKDVNKIADTSVESLLKMRCITDITDQSINNLKACLDPTQSSTCDAGNTTPMLVKPSQMTFKVYSKDHLNNKVLTFSKTLTTESSLMQYNHELILGKMQIPLNEILKKLPNGSFDSLQEITISGTLSICFKDYCYDSVTYKYYIGERDIPTWLNFEVKDNRLGYNVAGFSEQEQYTQSEINEKINQEEIEKQKQEELEKKQTINKNTEDLPDDGIDVIGSFTNDIKNQNYANLFDTVYTGVWIVLLIVVVIVIMAFKSDRTKVVSQ